MTDLLQARCHHHPEREAASLCPSCKNIYCRECIVEHAGRMICASCLAEKSKDTPTSKKKRKWLKPLIRLGTSLASLILIWLLFYLLGLSILKIPSPVHDGRPLFDVGESH